ncbi:hypothetical protein G4B88_017903 [Cannabis sativa]|uniref:Uncharacterized protein n=1 Tax=Cannabis sativa TaxID=3483 RepID=A0A7J6HID1_CANSA|nr:hypothetical protein G4B88_017903 [Cannabis sativa]
MLKGNSPNEVNFAVAGSTAIDHEFFVKNNLTLNYLEENVGCKTQDRNCIGADFDDTLFRVGAKYVVVQGFPMLGCLPLAMTLASQEDDRDNIVVSRV